MFSKHFKKQEPDIIMYCDYKKFSNQTFREEFVKELSEKNVQEDQFDLFQSNTLNILNKQALVKKKHIRNNQAAFVTKEIRKAIMPCSCLLNKFRKEKTEENKNVYNKQRNFGVSLVRKVKKNYLTIVMLNGLGAIHKVHTLKFAKYLTPLLPILTKE